MLNIEEGTYSQYKEELRPLIQEHFDEIELAGIEGIKLNLDDELYSFLEKNNQYLGLAIKNNEGAMVGYMSFIVYGNIHHKAIPFAMTDAFVIKKEYRHNNAFKYIIKAFKMAEVLLKEKYGVQYIQFIYSVNKDLSVLAKRLGYKPCNIMMIKQV